MTAIGDWGSGMFGHLVDKPKKVMKTFDQIYKGYPVGMNPNSHTAVGGRPGHKGGAELSSFQAPKLKGHDAVFHFNTPHGKMVLLMKEPDPKTGGAYVRYVGSPDGFVDKDAGITIKPNAKQDINAFGPRVMRDMIRAIRQTYPSMKSIVGERHFGVHGGEGYKRWTFAKMISFREALAKWDKNKHPRAKDGKFSTVAGIGTGHTQDSSKTWRTAGGQEADAATVARIKELKVPPAWRDVRVNPDRNAALQAVGFDAKGRPTALYSAAHHEAQAAKKFERLKRFSQVRDKLLKRAAEDAASGNEEAAALVLLGKTGMRIGSDRNTGAKVQAYGATTLQARHVNVNGSVTHLEFVGKKGVNISLTNIDPELARVMQRKMTGKSGNDRLFNTNDKKVRDYLHSIGGKGFMPKDFRTYVATSTALKLVDALSPAGGEREFKKMRKDVATHVSKMLGNTPAMAISSYIDPAVWHRIHPMRKAA